MLDTRYVDRWGRIRFRLAACTARHVSRWKLSQVSTAPFTTHIRVAGDVHICRWHEKQQPTGPWPVARVDRGAKPGSDRRVKRRPSMRFSQKRLHELGSNSSSRRSGPRGVGSVLVVMLPVGVDELLPCPAGAQCLVEKLVVFMIGLDLRRVEDAPKLDGFLQGRAG